MRAAVDLLQAGKRGLDVAARHRRQGRRRRRRLASAAGSCGGLGAAGVGHGDDAAHEAAEMRQEARGVFLAHHADDEADRLWAPAPPARPASGRWPRRRQGCGRRRATAPSRAQQARQGAVVEPLHARRPAHLDEAALHRSHP